MKLSCQRDRFDIPSVVTYLNAAYMGPLSTRVLQAGIEGLRRKVHPWNLGPDDFFGPVEEARRLFAQLIDADADGVALLPAVSYGIAVAAQNLTVRSGERIVVLAEEFPSNVYAWRELARRAGAEVVEVPRPENLDWTRAIIETVDERTAILAVPQCHWTDGGLVDLVRVGAVARDAGAALVIDGTQSIGAMRFDIAAVRPDVLVTANYKWLLGPYSSAFAWFAPDHREGRPLEYSWITRKRSDDFAHLVRYTDEFRDGARRYDVGETANFALLPAVTAALEQTLGWTVAEIERYVGQLTERLVAGVSALGLSVPPAGLRAPHLTGVHLRGANAEAIASALGSASVHVSVRGDAVRVSPHVYNDEGDVDRLVEVLRTAL